MRVSPWILKFNGAILPASVEPGQPFYRVYDAFTSRNGSWDLSNIEGGMVDWAREMYLRPYGAPDYFDDGGGDHHLFGAVVDPNTNKTIKEGRIFYYTWTDDANHVSIPVKTRSGWANNVVTNYFNPDMDSDPNTGVRGAWAWRPDTDLPCEEFRGGGLPFKWHVSWFVTWILDVASTEEPEPEPNELEETVENLEDWAVAWSKHNPEAPQYVKS